MSVTYTCPNPDCKANLKTPARVPTGKTVKCPKCTRPFVPEPEGGDSPVPAGAGTFKFADEPAKKPAAKAEAKKEEAAPAPARKPFEDDDDESPESVKKGYGVIEETEAEKEAAEKNKPTFNETQEKFKKSARGPAQGLLVMPANLLVGEGLITIAGGILLFVVGMWPLVFNDAPPGEEELDEAVIYMLLGCVTFLWGAMVCWGASHMQELGSYPLAMMGAIMGLVPLLVGVFAIIMLQNPKVKAGFEEGSGGPDDEEEEEEEEDEDDDGDEAEDDDDDDDGGGGAAVKAARKRGRKVRTDDEDDEDEDDE
jgi:hypothetical protein